MIVKDREGGLCVIKSEGEVIIRLRGWGVL